MANSKRGSAENLFSISGASEALGRSRRTITRALQGVAADTTRHGLKLWKMARIVEAVNTRTAVPILAAVENDELRHLFTELDAADTAMCRIESVEGRRAYAREALLPLLREVDEAMRADGRAFGEPEMVTDLRCDAHLQVFLVSGLGRDATGGCDWTPAEAWGAYNAGYEEAA